MQQVPISPPRLVVAGLAGDSGKTLVSLGLLLQARQHGVLTSAFKKGPDYIDAAWLGWAAGRPARNLDTYLMGNEKAVGAFCTRAVADGFNLIEGNRGLYDGFDARGTHSTGELAKLLRSPVLLVLDVTKVTHTAAALVLGCQTVDPAVQISGVILNRVAGKRHEAILRESIESTCHVPVLGVLPKSDIATMLPDRHLGLVTPEEHPNIDEVERRLLSLFAGRVDFEPVLDMARTAPALVTPSETVQHARHGEGLRVAYLRDSAFTFYYPENLEALEASGACLVPLSALTCERLPESLDALYVGGGFPETHGETIAANRSFLTSIREMTERGLPVYAECGGLMLLSQAIVWRGKKFPMAGVLPFQVEVSETPQGHGYTELHVDVPNGYYPVGITLRGHEFHYSGIVSDGHLPPTVCKVNRGTGCYAGRDGIILKNVWASYTHVHAVATPEWAEGLLHAAREFSSRRGILSNRWEDSG
ncbi:MAG TPA: cobyrinate a,c-diamide synthase [Terriglobia bacterium]|nr:cobyrinate a,c-diamide synthase [Terriglobia bacterium]